MSNHLNSFDARRRLFALKAPALLLPLVSGCGGGNSSSSGTGSNAGGAPVVVAPVPITPGTAVLTSTTIAGGIQTVTSVDTASGLTGVLYSAPGDINAKPVVNKIRVSDASNKANFYFDSDGQLSQWEEVTTGVATVVTQFSDRLEFRSYLPTGQFKSGYVVYKSGNAYLAGLLTAEEYLSLTQLTNVVDITSQLRAKMVEFTGTPGPFAARSPNRILFDLLPFSSAYADAFGDFGNGLLTAVAANIFAYVIVPAAAAFAVTLLVPGAAGIALGAGVGLLLSLLQVSKAKAATPASPAQTQTILPPPVVQPRKDGTDFGLARYAGNYSGTFDGNDRGSFSISIKPDGSISGQGTSVINGQFGLGGKISAGGKTLVATGSTSIGSSFSGIIDTRTAPVSLSGTWSNVFARLSGVYTGQKQ